MLVSVRMICRHLLFFDLFEGLDGAHSEIPSLKRWMEIVHRWDFGLNILQGGRTQFHQAVRQFSCTQEQQQQPHHQAEQPLGEKQGSLIDLIVKKRQY